MTLAVPRSALAGVPVWAGKEVNSARDMISDRATQ